MSLLLPLMLGGVAAADTVRVGLFVGQNIGFGPDEPLHYAEQEAREMAQVFMEMGDFERERTFVLQGPSADQVREAILQVEAQVREAEADGDDVLLVFYYSGHGSADGLHLEGDLLPMGVLRRWLEGSQADVRVAFVDACESGALARARGGTPVEHMDILVDDALTMSGLAIVTSTGPLSVAREADAFGGGVFSRALLNGLRGSADADNDGRITLDEAYSYAFAETVVDTGSASAGRPQTPEYRFDLEGVGQVVLTRLPSRAAGLVLPEELEGTYTVVSVTDGQVVARIEKQPGQVERLALPTGRYLVRKVRQEDVLVAELDLAWGGDRWLGEEQMSAVPLGDPLARGGWNLRPWRVGVDGGAMSPLMQGMPVGAVGQVQARYLARPNLGVQASVTGQRGVDEGDYGEITVRAARVSTGVVYERHRPRLDWTVSGGPELALVSQTLEYLDYDEEEDDEPYVLAAFERAQILPGGHVGVGVHVPVGPVVGLNAGARAHLLYGIVDDTPRLMAEMQLTVGLSVGFGGRSIARAQKD